MEIREPCIASLTWRLEDAHGNLIDHLDEPADYFVGGEELFPRVQALLIGQGEGFEATLHLEPEDAFGAYEAELVCFEERGLFPDLLEPGLQYEGLPPGSASTGMPTDVIYTVTEVYDSHVVLDGNHALAGIALVLQVKVHAVREPDDDEQERRSAAPPGLSLAAPVPPGTTVH